MFFEIGVLKKFAIFKGKHLCWSLFLIKQAYNVIKKKTPPQMLSCEYSKNFKSSFFYRTAFFIPPVPAPKSHVIKVVSTTQYFKLKKEPPQEDPISD